MSGMVGVLALGVALAGLVPSTAHAQKSIDFFTTGSVRSTLVFTNQIVPDTYYFFATAGASSLSACASVAVAGD